MFFSTLHVVVRFSKGSEAIDAVVAKNRTVKGWAGKVSLCDLGYCSVGIDEGWEGCGMGAVVDGRKTQHYANGTPAINNKFPDMVRRLGAACSVYL